MKVEGGPPSTFQTLSLIAVILTPKSNKYCTTQRVQVFKTDLYVVHVRKRLWTKIGKTFSAFFKL